MPVLHSDCYSNRMDPAVEMGITVAMACMEEIPASRHQADIAVLIWTGRVGVTDVLVIIP